MFKVVSSHTGNGRPETSTADTTAWSMGHDLMYSPTMATFSSFFGVPAIRSHVCANFSIDIVAAGATRPGSCATLRHGLLPEVTVVGRLTSRLAMLKSAYSVLP